MYSTDSRCYDPLNPSGNFQHEDKLIIYKTLVSNKDQCVIIVGRWDILPGTVQKHHISHNTTIENLTKSYFPVIRRPRSVTLAQTRRKNRETDIAGRHKVSGEG